MRQIAARAIWRARRNSGFICSARHLAIQDPLGVEQECIGVAEQYFDLQRRQLQTLGNSCTKCCAINRILVHLRADLISFCFFM